MTVILKSIYSAWFFPHFVTLQPKKNLLEVFMIDEHISPCVVVKSNAFSFFFLRENLTSPNLRVKAFIVAKDRVMLKSNSCFHTHNGRRASTFDKNISLYIYILGMQHFVIVYT